MKRTFQITLVVVGAIPLVLGIVNFIFGSGRVVSEDLINPNLDNMWRFYSVWFTVVFFLAVWCARNLEIAGPVLRIMFITMAAGGLARIYSITQVDSPKRPCWARLRSRSAFLPSSHGTRLFCGARSSPHEPTAPIPAQSYCGFNRRD